MGNGQFFTGLIRWNTLSHLPITKLPSTCLSLQWDSFKRTHTNRKEMQTPLTEIEVHIRLQLISISNITDFLNIFVNLKMDCWVGRLQALWQMMKLYTGISLPMHPMDQHCRKVYECLMHISDICNLMMKTNYGILVWRVPPLCSQTYIEGGRAGVWILHCR